VLVFCEYCDSFIHVYCLCTCVGLQVELVPTCREVIRLLANLFII